MINTILDIIRLLNDGNIVPMQKDEDTKIDLYNEKVQLFMDASGEESKYYYFSELEINDENQDNLAEIEDVALNSDAYGDTKGLDILLIDDPLQTIDDISAISLADLLTQQGIGQIVLSTHEEAKAALLRYKFKHAGMSVREQNMQALYMKTVTEE